MERNGIGKEYSIKGKIKSEKEYLNRKLWNMKQYDKNNNLINEIKEGKGLIKAYYTDGTIKSEIEFSDGEMNGKIKRYYNTGQLRSEEDYKNGKRNGKTRVYE